MSQDTKASPQNRSWTDQRAQSTNRSGMLGFLTVAIAILIAVYLYFLTIPRDVKTHIVRIAVKDYGDGVPNPEFGIWELKRFREQAELNGLAPWEIGKTPAEPYYKNQPDFKNAILQIPAQCSDLKPKDTLIIQLRCHAVVAPNSAGNREDLWGGFFVGEAANNEAIYPFEDVLNELKALPVQNIVLFADICDLKSVPHRGWVVNPIVQCLLDACKKKFHASETHQNNLWIVCAAKDYQSPFYSLKRERTLFQAACEKALQQSPGTKFLSLATYFDSITRYCDHESQGNQIPLLIHAQTHRLCKSTEPGLWAEASNVSICSHKSKPVVVKEKKGSENKSEPSEKTSAVWTSQLTTVSFQDAPPRKVDDVDPKDNKSNAIKIEEDLELRFWQLRDQLEGTPETDDAKWNWSPVDFSPYPWRKIQSDALRDPSNGKRARVEVLESLQRAIATDRTTTGKSDDPLIRAWNDFLKDNQNIRFWNDPSRLPSRDVDDWRKLRKEFRKYIVGVSELVAWRDLTFEFPVFENDYQALVDSLEMAKKQLPSNPAEFALGKSREMRLDASYDARLRLQAKLKEEINRLTLSAVELTWGEEREFQVLLASPILRYEQRKTLASEFKKRKTKSEIASNDKSQINLENSNSDRGVRYCEELRRTTLFFADSLRLPGSETIRLLQWGTDYKEQNGKPENLVNQWHYFLLAEPGFGALESTKSNSGIVVSPVNKHAIRLSCDRKQVDFSAEAKNTATLDIHIEYADESDVDACALTGFISSLAAPSKPMKDSPISIAIRNGSKMESLSSHQPVKVRPQAKGLNIQCKLESETSDVNEGILNFIAFDSEGNPSEPLQISVFRNAKQIQLYASRLQEGTAPVVVSKDMNPASSVPTFLFTGPAVLGSSNSFAFSLENKLLKERKASLKVYAVSEKDWELYEKRGSLVAQSESVPLPSQKIVPIKLTHEGPPVRKDAVGSLLVFRINEFESVGDQERKLEPTTYLGRFVPSSPISQEMALLSVVPGPNKPDKKMRIDMETSKEILQKYNLKELPVEIDYASLDLKARERNWTQLPSLTSVLNSQKTSGSVESLPISQGKVFKFELNIGGYPRALVFEAKPGEETPEPETPAQVEIKSIIPIASGVPMKVQVKKVDSRWVFPNKENGEAMSYTSLRISTKSDFHLSNKATLTGRSLQKEGQGVSALFDPSVLESDRTILVDLTSSEQDGALLISYRPEELTIDQDIKANQNGVFAIKLESGAATATQEIVFDTGLPRTAEVQCQGAPELYSGQSLEIWIEDKDEVSGVESVVFAISSDNKKTEYHPSWVQEELKPLVGEKMRCLLNAKSLEEKGVKVNSQVTIVARTTDYAGNVQDNNVPLRVVWKGKPTVAGKE